MNVLQSLLTGGSAPENIATATLYQTQHDHPSRVGSPASHKTTPARHIVSTRCLGGQKHSGLGRGWVGEGREDRRLGGTIRDAAVGRLGAAHRGLF